MSESKHTAGAVRAAKAIGKVLASPPTVERPYVDSGVVAGIIDGETGAAELLAACRRWERWGMQQRGAAAADVQGVLSDTFAAIAKAEGGEV